MIQLMAPMLVLAEEVSTGSESSGGIELLLPETPELIAGLIAFAIIFFFVWKWVIPAANTALEARQEAITGKLTEAEKAKQDAESLLDDYKAQLAKARDEANEIVDGARQSAETVRTDLVAKAESDAEAIRSKAREDAAAEKERAAGQIRDEVASLSLELAQKVVAGSVDEATQRSLVERYIDDLGQLNT